MKNAASFKEQHTERERTDLEHKIRMKDQKIDILRDKVLYLETAKDNSREQLETAKEVVRKFNDSHPSSWVQVAIICGWVTFTAIGIVIYNSILAGA